MGDSIRVEFGFDAADVRRRRREASRVRLRGGPERWLIGVLVAAIAAGFAALGVAAGVDDPIEVAVIASPVIVLLAVAGWALRPVRTRPRRRRAEPGHACEAGPAGLRLVSDPDELTYAWDMVPEVAWEPNWIALALPFGEIAIPRDAFAPGQAEAFAAMVAERRGHRAPVSPVPFHAARFQIAPEQFDETGHGRLLAAARGASGGALVAVAALVLWRVGAAQPLGAAVVAAFGVVGGAYTARHFVLARRRLLEARSGELAVWIDKDALVERGDGWEHRFPRRRVDAVTREGSLLLVQAAGTCCVIPADSLLSTPSLRTLIGDRLASAGPGGLGGV